MRVSDGLSFADYVGGSAAFVAVVMILAWGAWRLREALLPDWSGARARLAEAVVFVAVPISTAQALGTIDSLRAVPVGCVCAAVALAMGIVGRRMTSARATVVDEPSTRRGPTLEIAGVVLATATVAAQWATHVADAFDRGMTHGDTVWYHMPYTAHFFQSASLAGVPDRADVIQAYYPLNSSLVHTLVTLPFDTDVLSPLVNLGWAAIAILAAYCIGRRYGAAHLSVLGAVVVLGLPMLTATQPGQASNDVMCAGLLLASVALLLESDLAPRPTAIAGIAAGLALGTKLTVLAPVALLALGVIVVALRAGRRLTAGVWTAAVALFGAYWYVHNWVVADNPLPWFSVDVGPISLPQAVHDDGTSLFDNLTYAEGWRLVFAPGFEQALGRAWPLVLLLAVAIGLLVALKRHTALERVVGITVVGAVVGYVLTPSGGGLNFVFNVRYLTPALLLGFVALPLALTGLGERWRRGALLVLVALVVVDAAGRNRERIPGWPSDQLAIGIVVGVVVVVVGAVLLARGATVVATPRRLACGAGIAVVLVLAIGWPVQQHYLERRYVSAGIPLDGINAYFRVVHDADVVAFGTVETYPMFGLDLSNRVHTGQGPSSTGDGDPCEQYERLRAGAYRYVVLANVPATEGGVIIPIAPPEHWFTDDNAASLVARDGKSVAYRIDGPLDPQECRTP